MGRNLTFLGLPRYKLLSPAFGTTAVPTMPASNLGTWEPWEIGRISSPDTVKAYLDTRLEMPNAFDPGTFEVGGVGIVNHNLSLGAQVRVLLLDEDAAGYAPARIPPDSVVVESGTWTGAVTDVDDDPHGATPGADFMGLTSAAGNLRFTFGTPPENPVVGADLQAFRFRLKYDNAPDGFVVQLYEGGVHRATLSIVLPNGGSQSLPNEKVFLVYWNAGSLSTADGSAVECRILVQKVVAGDLFQLQALDWDPDLELSAGAAIADSGWVDAQVDPYNASWGGTVPSSIGVAPQQTFVHLFSSNLAGVYRVVVFFRDPANVDGSIDLGEAVIGPTFTPNLNRDWGELVSFMATDRVVKGAGGSRWGTRSEPVRRMPIPLASLEPAEAYALCDRLWPAGTLTPFIVSVTPDDTTERRHTSLYVCAENLPKVSGQDIDFRNLSFDVVEKL